MNNLDNIVNSYNSNLEKCNELRSDTIKNLYALRKRALKLVENANKTLERRNAELKAINETICEVQGHTYTEWEENAGFLDRSWFYTRTCKLCGKKERVEDEPFEFRSQSLKRKK